MTFFAIIQAFLEAATQYFRLKNQTVYFDLLEKFDSRLDKLDKMRQILRSKPDSDSQMAADSVVSEITEEKRKLAEIKKQFNNK
jgi:hypothetical protein